jgi:hypothetical protein
MYAASEAGVDGGKVGGDIELGVVAAPSFISVHLGSEVEEERFAERLGAGCARVDDRVRAAVANNLETSLIETTPERGRH